MDAGFNRRKAYFISHCRTEERAQDKYLWCQHKDLSSDSLNPRNKLVMAVRAYNPSREGRDGQNADIIGELF